MSVTVGMGYSFVEYLSRSTVGGRAPCTTYARIRRGWVSVHTATPTYIHRIRNRHQQRTEVRPHFVFRGERNGTKLREDLLVALKA